MRNDRLDRLAEFPFRRLAALLAHEPAPRGPTHRSGAGRAPARAAGAAGRDRRRPRASVEPLPAGPGTPEFRAAVAAWLTRRFDLPPAALDPDRHVAAAGRHQGGPLPPALAGHVPSRGTAPAVLMPDPVYAVYYGAAVMAGAEPVLLPATAATGFLPDLDAMPPRLLDRTALFYLCTPGQPAGCRGRSRTICAGRCASPGEHGFLLAVDECYSELWDTAPPPGALEAALAEDGDFDRRRGVPLAEQAVERRRPALRLRRRRCRRAGAPAAAARLRLAGAAPAAAGRRHRALAGRGPCRGEPRALPRQVRPRRSGGSATGSASTARPAASSSGSTSATARPPAAALWREGGIRVLPGGYLSGRQRQRPNAGTPYIRVALVDEIGTVDAALERLADGAGGSMNVDCEERPMAASTADAFAGAPAARAGARQPAPSRRRPADRRAGGRPGRGA